MDIFDILGPVMVGPSSSHTAGAARIGAMARTLLGEPVTEAKIHLYGSGMYSTLIVRNQDEFGSVAGVTNILSQLRINVANMSLSRQKRGGDALMVIEIDQHMRPNQVQFLAELPAALWSGVPCAPSTR